MSFKTMQVRMTEVLRANLVGKGLNPEKLLTDFAVWKSGDEYGHFFFGKDSAYVNPPVNGDKNVLRHVHLVPLLDIEQLQRWKKAYQRQSRKTSDRVLVYVADSRYGYLLIFILDEPDAHRIAQMKNEEDRDTMEGFAAVADEFIHNGAIIC